MTFDLGGPGRRDIYRDFDTHDGAVGGSSVLPPPRPAPSLAITLVPAFLAATSTLAAVALLLTRWGRVREAVVAWLLAGLLTFTLMSLHWVSENRARTHPDYGSWRGLPVFLVALGLVAVAAVVASAIVMALWAGRNWRLS